MDPHPDSPADLNPHRDLIARVVAWHNRQPLARRITADQVRGIGVVALPFLAAPGAAGVVSALQPGGRAAVEPTWDAEPDAAADPLAHLLAPPLAHAPAGPAAAADSADAGLSLPERAAARLQAGDGEPAVTPEVDAAAGAADPASAASTEAMFETRNPALPLAAQAAVPAPAPAPVPAPAPAPAPTPALASAAPSRFAKLARWWPLRRAAAPVSQGALASAFNEDFIAPLKPRQVARFARRHGSTERPGDSAEPQRDVLVDGAPRPVVRLYLRSAAIEVGDRRLRVLVGAGSQPAVIGPRLWSRPRVGGAAALGLSCMVAAAAALWLPGRLAADERAATVAQHAGPAASAASAASASLAASAPLAAASDSHGPGAALALQVSAEPAAAGASTPAAELHAAAAASSAFPAPAVVSASSAPHGQPAVAAVASASSPASAPGGAEKPAADVRPDIRPHLTAGQRDAARREGEQLRALSPAHKTAPQAAAGTLGPAAGDGHSYALVTRATRGRAASEVMLSLMVSAAAGTPGSGQPRTEVMQVPQGWRAVWWPFGSLADAEGARAALAQYGINAEIVEF